MDGCDTTSKVCEPEAKPFSPASVGDKYPVSLKITLALLSEKEALPTPPDSPGQKLRASHHLLSPPWGQGFSGSGFGCACCELTERSRQAQSRRSELCLACVCFREAGRVQGRHLNAACSILLPRACVAFLAVSSGSLPLDSKAALARLSCC